MSTTDRRPECLLRVESPSMFFAGYQIRPDERALVASGLLTLAALMCGHVLVETAGDAIFLANIPAQQLPFLYLAIAILALSVTRLQRFMGRWLDHDAILVGWLGFAVVMAIGLWSLLDQLGHAGIYVLYVFPGVISTVTLIHFWSIVGDAVTVDDAKRLYVYLGAGGAVGAIVGSATATLLAGAMPARHLLLAAAVVWAFAPAGVRWLSQTSSRHEPAADEPSPDSSQKLVDWQTLQTLVSDLYTRRIAILALLLPVASIFGDYLFKSLAAERVATASLGTFFGSVYLLLNVVSLTVQLLVVRGTVRQIGIAGSLAVLPVFLTLGGAGIAVGMAFTSAITVKVVDGSFRHSLHQTATELLYVPLPDDLRRELKAFTTTVGKRGGQALGSIGLLALLAVGASTALIGAVLSILAIFATIGAFLLRAPYLELFRSRLRDERLEHLFDYPDLDVDSLEALVAHLNSGDDAEVLAAMDLLVAEGRSRAIPALILYHPSEKVVRRALSAFVDADVEEVVPVIDRVAPESPASIHAAFLSARSALRPDRRLLEVHLDYPDPLVRSTAAFHLVARGWRTRQELGIDFDQVVRDGDTERQQTFAFAIGVAGAAEFGPELGRLLDDDDTEVRREAVRAMTRIGDRKCLEELRTSLVDREIRKQVLRAFASFGDRGFEFLCQSFDDPAVQREARWQLPRAIGQFESDRAVDVLAARLPVESDGIVRTRLVAELERLQLLHEEIEMPREPLRQSLESFIRRGYRFMDWRCQLEKHEVASTSDSDPLELLTLLLADKEGHAADLVLRLVGLIFPDEDISRVRRGLTSENPTRRSSALELLEALLPGELRSPVLGIVDDRSDEVSLQAAESFYRSRRLDREALLTAMLQTESQGLALLVAEYAVDRQVTGLIEPLRDARQTASSEVRAALDRAIRRLTDRGSDPHAAQPIEGGRTKDTRLN